jgi:HK97 family phage portal protein
LAFWSRKNEQRDVTSGLANPAGFLTEGFAGTNTAPSGQKVTVDKALTLGPVWAAVSMISEQVGQLPLKVYKKDDSGQRIEATSHRSWSLLHDKPNPDTPADRFWATVTLQLLMWGNSFIEKVRDPVSGVVDSLYLLDPNHVTVEYDPNTRMKRFKYQPINGQPMQLFSTDDVLHIFGPSTNGIVGMSVIQCKASLGAALARDEFEGSFYLRGANLSGALKTPNKLGVDAATNLKDSFAALFGGSAKAHGVPVFEEGLEWVQIGSPMKDLEFVASQQLSRTDIAVMFKLPPNYLGGSSGDSLVYSTVEMNQEHFALHAIAPWTNTIAKALSNDPSLLPQNVFYAEFTLEAMLRANAKDRGDFYQTLSSVKAITADEIRQRENLPALTQAQKDELSPPQPEQLQIPGTTPDMPQQMPANVTALPSAN